MKLSSGKHYRKRAIVIENYKKLPGTPDIVLTKYKIVIFCDSQFFHGKDWDVLKPRLEKGNNPKYWVNKIQENMDRDSNVDKELLYLGWTVLHFWGKDILKKTDECVRVVEELIFDLTISTEDEMERGARATEEFKPLKIEDRLGHEKIETTLSIYSQLYPNKQIEVAERIEIVNGEEKELFLRILIDINTSGENI